MWMLLRWPWTGRYRVADMRTSGRAVCHIISFVASPNHFSAIWWNSCLTFTNRWRRPKRSNSRSLLTSDVAHRKYNLYSTKIIHLINQLAGFWPQTYYLGARPIIEHVTMERDLDECFPTHAPSLSSGGRIGHPYICLTSLSRESLPPAYNQ